MLGRDRAPARSWWREPSTPESPRKDKPFVAVNCAALTGDACWSRSSSDTEEAPSPARSHSRKGRFELADGGTLFLDEIGEIPPAMQVKLLRVLQEGEFERVGGQRRIKVDVRVVAATNRDLRRGSDQGKFREDLYYRLNVVTVDAPAAARRARRTSRSWRRHFLRDVRREDEQEGHRHRRRGR